MPKIAIDYSQTIMYKLVCKDLNIKETYVGHTTDFRRRKSNHKQMCKRDNQKVYIFIRDNGGWENWDMIEIEKYPCADGNEARARERYWYETLEASLNTINPNRNKKEYREKTKKIRAEKDKEWYSKNREEISIKMKKRMICQCGLDIAFNSYQKHKKSPKHIFFSSTNI